MDSLIHYRCADIAAALSGLAARTRGSVVFTVAPSTPALQAMHLAGKAFPRADRSPAIVPVRAAALAAALAPLSDWHLEPFERIKSGFYISEAMEFAPR